MKTETNMKFAIPARMILIVAVFLPGRSVFSYETVDNGIVLRLPNSGETGAAFLKVVDYLLKCKVNEIEDKNGL
jgi:hypothetical protein